MLPLAPRRVLRTSRQMSWFLLGIPIASLATVLLPLAMGKSMDGFLLPTAVMAIMVLIAIFLVKTTALSLTNDAIHYQSLLRKVDIGLADVVKVESAFGFVAFSYKPYQRIVVTVRKTSGDKEKEIILNGGLFDQREIKQWVEACNATLHKSS